MWYSIERTFGDPQRTLERSVLTNTCNDQGLSILQESLTRYLTPLCPREMFSEFTIALWDAGMPRTLSCPGRLTDSYVLLLLLSIGMLICRRPIGGCEKLLENRIVRDPDPCPCFYPPYDPEK